MYPCESRAIVSVALFFRRAALVIVALAAHHALYDCISRRRPKLLNAVAQQRALSTAFDDAAASADRRRDAHDSSSRHARPTLRKSRRRISTCSRRSPFPTRSPASRRASNNDEYASSAATHAENAIPNIRPAKRLMQTRTATRS